MKVYCENCEWYREYRWYSDYMGYYHQRECASPENSFYEESFFKRSKVKKGPEELNNKNDCSFYKRRETQYVPKRTFFEKLFGSSVGRIK